MFFKVSFCARPRRRKQIEIEEQKNRDMTFVFVGCFWLQARCFRDIFVFRVVSGRCFSDGISNRLKQTNDFLFEHQTNRTEVLVGNSHAHTPPLQQLRFKTGRHDQNSFSRAHGKLHLLKC